MTIFSSNTVLLILLTILGVIFSTLWFFNLKNYKQLNKCKFHIIQKIEKKLPKQATLEINKADYVDIFQRQLQIEGAIKTDLYSSLRWKF